MKPQDVFARLRRVRNGESTVSVYGFDGEEMDSHMHRMLENSHIADLEVVATHYLSEHPFDEDEPITAEWERIASDRVTANGEFVFSATATLDIVHHPGSDMWYISDDLPNVTCIRPLETRGQLRRLTAALTESWKRSDS